MTDTHYGALQSLIGWFEMWEKNRMLKSDGHVKSQVNWLCGEFGMVPVNWGCQGCVRQKNETLARLYKKEKELREKL